MAKENNVEKARKNVLRSSKDSDLKLPEVHGYDFDSKLDYDKLIDSLANTGFQATALGQAIDIIKQMRKDKCTIYLGYTSNLVTSGLRDVFKYLAKHKLVDIIVTTGGGIEEDIIKCLGPFYVGEYGKFEDFFVPLLEKISKEQKSIAVSDLVWKMGEAIDNDDSIYYWCAKNKIPVFCPTFTDGSIGDMIYFFKAQNKELLVDISEDIKKLNILTLDAKKTGLIILGSGVVKHHICNANMMRNGADYAVYINNSQEFDGSDSGARPDEAVSWGKILPKAKSVKVYGDATILFPLIVAKCFKE